MKRNFIRSGLLAVMVATAALGTTAHAGDSEDFAGCDGLMKPKGKADGMRGAASITSFSYFGASSTSPMTTIQSCNRALANPKLKPTQTLRRAHLLRARAAAYLAMDKPKDALVDLDAADLAVADVAQDIFFHRSMGASLMLMRAAALSATGEKMEAARLAEEAAALRPYAVQVQMAAALIRNAARTVGESSVAPWDTLMLLEPGVATAFIRREAELGNFAGVMAMAAQAPIVIPEDELASAGIFIGGIETKTSRALNASLDLAYAQAATGGLAAARETVERVRARLAMPDAGANSRSDTGVDADGTIFAPKPPIPFLQSLIEARKKSAERGIALTEARIALAEGRVDDAQAATMGVGLPGTAAALEFFEALNLAQGNNPDYQPIKLEPLRELLAQNRKQSIASLGNLLLIAPESRRNIIDYEKSRPNILGELVGAAFSFGTTLLDGIDRTAGFKSTVNADGSVVVEYTGSTNSGPMVQEMTLLRAAELAREANKPRFAILNREDSTRYLVSMQYGSEVSRVPTGYKTELTIRYLDAEEAGPPAFDAITVIDALGPLYYETGTGKRAGRAAAK